MKPGARAPALLERIDLLAREIAELRVEVAHELGLDGDDEIAQLAAEDLRRATKRARRAG